VSKILLIAAIAVAGLYLAVTGLLFAGQRQMIYPAPRMTPIDRGRFREAILQTSDGLRLKALYQKARGDLPTLIFFHGNGDNLAGAMAATSSLAANGYGLLLPEYRGYGGNPGSPSEAGLYRDGEAALQWLREGGVPIERVVLVGNSLGSGVATELTAWNPVRGLVLISGFTSLADVAASHMRLFPVRLLLRDRYDNRAKLSRVTAPVLIVHGQRDTLIPVSHAEALARSAQNVQLVVDPATGHELAYLPQAQSAVLRWLRGD
jgi:hypothetical protein